MMMPGKNDEERVLLSELDDQLKNDKDGSFRKSLIDKIQRYRVEAKAKMNAGKLKPSEYDIAKKYESALENAQFILEKLPRA